MITRLRRALRPVLKPHPRLWQAAIDADAARQRLTVGLVERAPWLVRPELRQIHVAVTSYCNLRCTGCRYGRDFMPNRQLPWRTVREMLDDAAELGAWTIRFYGGEPLLHPDLPKMVGHATDLALGVYVTTNGMLLAEKFPELYDAGLRQVTLGYYGTGKSYDEYVDRQDRYERLEAGIAFVRDEYGDEVDIRINWLLMRPSCTLRQLHAAYDFALRYRLRIQVDLVHYSLPYFTEGPDRKLQFRAEDRPAIERVTRELIRLKKRHPDVIQQDLPGLRSIPDWLLLGPEMRVPCNANQMLWIGADGTVQLCYVTFPLGNLHEERLSKMLFGRGHREAGQAACRLDCPNCHCGYDTRVRNHGPSLARYGR